uniref:Plastocyanin n=1 Tax=Anthurium amnicola TaxID=1678845 RepID=A0A1D1Z076_9ARAE
MMSFQRQISKKLIVLILFCFFVDCIFADPIVIQVGGGGPDNLKFVPANFTANKGDTIRWVFMGGNHNVVESQGEGSCDMKEHGSFGSLTNPPSKDYNLTISQDRGIITYMCSVGSHCSAGMWGIIYVGGTEPPTFVKPTPINKANNANNDTNANNTGKAAGIVIGSVIGFAIVSAIGFLVAKRYRSRQRTVPTIEGIKRVDEKAKTGQAKKDHEVQLEDV